MAPCRGNRPLCPVALACKKSTRIGTLYSSRDIGTAVWREFNKNSCITGYRDGMAGYHCRSNHCRGQDSIGSLAGSSGTVNGPGSIGFHSVYRARRSIFNSADRYDPVCDHYCRAVTVSCDQLACGGRVDCHDGGASPVVFFISRVVILQLDGSLDVSSVCRCCISGRSRYLLKNILFQKFGSGKALGHDCGDYHDPNRLFCYVNRDDGASDPSRNSC